MYKSARATPAGVSAMAWPIDSDRIGVGRGKGGQESQETLEDKKRTESWLPSCILAALTHPLYDTVNLDSGSEARYVRRQGRGLGI